MSGCKRLAVLLVMVAVMVASFAPVAQAHTNPYDRTGWYWSPAAYTGAVPFETMFCSDWGYYMICAIPTRSWVGTFKVSHWYPYYITPEG